jgi:hypothetical protein
MTSRWFGETADAILGNVSMAETTLRAQDSGLTAQGSAKEFQTTVTDLRILAQLARFHGSRSRAAVFYNMFKADRDPKKLVLAVQNERAAVDAWRKLVEAAGDKYTDNLAMGACNYSLCGHWRDELTVLEKGLTELNQQLVELGVAGLQVETDAVVWPRLVIDGDRVTTAAPGRPLRISARVSPTRGIAAVRLRYRSVTQFADYSTIEMQPAGEPGVYTATVPGTALNPKWDFMYFIEAIRESGEGALWPDLLKETPYVIVKLQR